MEQRTISASRLKTYKSCPRLFYLQYHEELVPISDGDALTKGRKYHEKIDELVRTGDYTRTGDVTDAMLYAFEKYILPKLNIKETEKGFEKRLTKKLTLNGFFDAISEDGIVIEHKTCGVTVDEKYVYSLNWDEQVTVYMLASKKNKVIYTVIQKPTIRLRQNETEEEHIERCKAWYDEQPNLRTAVFPVVRSDEEIKEKRKEIILIDREIAKRKLWYCNPSQCKVLGCRYSSICLSYQPEFLVDFIKKEKRNEHYENTGY